MSNVTHACADCLEAAGGRQQLHNCAWHVDTCPCCLQRTALAAARDFGSPLLSLKILPLTQEKEPA